MELSEIRKKIDKYQALADKNYMTYQETGEPRYLTAYEKYEELTDVYTMALKYKEDEDTEKVRRMRNVTAFIKDHIEDVPKETYTKEEVIELAKRIKDVML